MMDIVKIAKNTLAQAAGDRAVQDATEAGKFNGHEVLRKHAEEAAGGLACCTGAACASPMHCMGIGHCSLGPDLGRLRADLTATRSVDQHAAERAVDVPLANGGFGVSMVAFGGEVRRDWDRPGYDVVPASDELQRRERTITPTILLSSGRYFDFTNPTLLTEQEVAHALAHLCRFTGHCSEFYSVAQHSVLVAMLLPKPLKLWGLLHDAVETVVGDMASPLKRLFPEYKALEHRCEAVILEGFGLHGPVPPEVKRADLVALRTEQRDLMPTRGGLWTCLDGIEAVGPPGFITSWPPEVARKRFLMMYRELTGQRVAA